MYLAYALHNNTCSLCAVTLYAISWGSKFQLLDDVVCNYVTNVLPNIGDFKELNTISINYMELVF